MSRNMNNPINWPSIRSHSGDVFHVPPENFEKDRNAYTVACQSMVESIMLFYEEGNTGWVYEEQALRMNEEISKKTKEQWRRKNDKV